MINPPKLEAEAKPSLSHHPSSQKRVTIISEETEHESISMTTLDQERSQEQLRLLDFESREC